MKPEFNSNTTLLAVVKGNHTTNRIIALFALAKGVRFENMEQWVSYIRRNSRAASLLKGYSLERIRETLLYLLETADYKVALETVTKFIDEDIEKLRGRKAIINLMDGENVYDVARIQELESAGKIYYDNGKWKECI